MNNNEKCDYNNECFLNRKICKTYLKLYGPSIENQFQMYKKRK